jgi:hypothetical protein
MLKRAALMEGRASWQPDPHAETIKTILQKGKAEISSEGHLQGREPMSCFGETTFKEKARRKPRRDLQQGHQKGSEDKRQVTSDKC